MSVLGRILGGTKCPICERRVSRKDAFLFQTEVDTETQMSTQDRQRMTLLQKSGCRFLSPADTVGGLYVCADCARDKVMPAARKWVDQIANERQYSDADKRVNLNRNNQLRIDELKRVMNIVSNERGGRVAP